jgi:uncharacterized OsmC-like protein
MPTITSKYTGQLRTEAIHVKSGAQLITDAPTDNHGKGESFSPTDTVAGALASCMMTIMGIESQKAGFEIGEIHAEVTKIMKADPRTISKIKIHFTYPNCELTEDQRSFIKDKALSCPVALSLHPDLKQEVTFDF